MKMIKKPKPVIFVDTAIKREQDSLEAGIHNGREDVKRQVKEILDEFQMEIFSDNNARIDKDRCVSFIRRLREVGI